MNPHEILNRRYRPPIKNYDGTKRYKYAHYKRDGHFLRLEAEGSAVSVRYQAWTRRPTDISHALHSVIGESTILPMLQRMFATASPGDRWLLFGEIYYPGQPSSYVKTGIAERDSRLVFECFAIGAMPAHSLNELENMPLPELEEICYLHGIPFAPYYDCEYFDTPPDPADLELPAYDCEGFVLKDGNLTGWQKWKSQRELDAVITGFTDGEGKYFGLIGSITVSVEGREIAHVSGMSDEMREYFTYHAAELIGKVITVRYQYVGARGRLRHPQFVALRDDKKADECLLTQDPELVRVWETT